MREIRYSILFYSVVYTSLFSDSLIGLNPQIYLLVKAYNAMKFKNNFNTNHQWYLFVYCTTIL